MQGEGPQSPGCVCAALIKRSRTQSPCAFPALHLMHTRPPAQHTLTHSHIHSPTYSLTLTQSHTLAHPQERDIIALYRLLYSYSVGFFTDVQSLVEGSVMTAPRGVAGGGGAAAALSGLRQELLENVFRAYASLWDEALMIVFDSEMAAVLAEKTAALQALDAGVVELEALRQENEQLQVRVRVRVCVCGGLCEWSISPPQHTILYRPHTPASLPSPPLARCPNPCRPGWPTS